MRPIVLMGDSDPFRRFLDTTEPVSPPTSPYIKRYSANTSRLTAGDGGNDAGSNRKQITSAPVTAAFTVNNKRPSLTTVQTNSQFDAILRYDFELLT